MKSFIVLLAMFCCTGLHAQKISFHKDTVLADKFPYLIYHSASKLPMRDSIWTLNGKQIATVHSSHTEINGKQAYVLAFVSSGRQCMVLRGSNYPLSLCSEMMKYNVLNANHLLQAEGELSFIKAHPLPPGYIDIDGHGEDWRE